MTITIRPFRTGGWEVDIVLPLPNSDKPYRDRVKAPVASKSDAKKWGRARESAALEYILKHGEAPPKKRGKAAKRAEEVTTKQTTTLAEFVPIYFEKHVPAERHRPGGIRTREGICRNHLIPVLGHRPLDQIDGEDVRTLKAHLENHSAKTVNNILSALNSLLSAAKEMRVITEIPVKARWLKTTKPKMEFYDFDDYERLLAGARRVDPRSELVVLLGGEAGLRCGEMRALLWESIDFKNELITIERAYSHDQITMPKGDKIRTVPMTARVLAALKARFGEYGGESENVLVTDEGEPPNPHAINVWLYAAQNEAGLPEKGPHKLRHTFCSHLAMSGAYPMEIKELAGHEDIETTMQYMHLSQRALREAVNRLNGTAAPRLGDVAETTPAPLA